MPSPCVVIMAGPFQIGFGVHKLGRHITLMPYPVISGFMTGIGCIIIILQLAPLLGYVNPPGGTLAAIAGLGEALAHTQGDAVKVGIDIVDWDYLRRVRRAPVAGVMFMFVVLLLTVFVDLITAVAVGVVMASLLFVKRMTDLQLESIKAIVDPTDDASFSPEERETFKQCRGQVLYVHLGGTMSFGAANEMARRLSAQVAFQILILDLFAVPTIDSSASLAVEEVIERALAARRLAVESFSLFDNRCRSTFPY